MFIWKPNTKSLSELRRQGTDLVLIAIHALPSRHKKLHFSNGVRKTNAKSIYRTASPKDTTFLNSENRKPSRRSTQLAMDPRNPAPARHRSESYRLPIAAGLVAYHG